MKQRVKFMTKENGTQVIGMEYSRFLLMLMDHFLSLGYLTHHGSMTHIESLLQKCREAIGDKAFCLASVIDKGKSQFLLHQDYNVFILFSNDDPELSCTKVTIILTQREEDTCGLPVETVRFVCTGYQMHNYIYFETAEILSYENCKNSMGELDATFTVLNLLARINANCSVFDKTGNLTICYKPYWDTMSSAGALYKFPLDMILKTVGAVRAIHFLLEFPRELDVRTGPQDLCPLH